MKYLLTTILIILIGVIMFNGLRQKQEVASKVSGEEIKLPRPRLKGSFSIEEVLVRRRSVRQYQGVALKFEDLSQILWAGQGVTHPAGFRTAPSAGATYPLNLYAVVGEVEKISPGLYQYQPQSHSLVRILAGDLRKSLARASLGQKWVELAPVNLVITALYSRITPRYGKRGIRYAQIEVGHIGENIYLQAEALKIGTVAVGAFDDEEVKKILSLSSEEVPLYIMPLGYQKKK